jgi:hypothetical protein
MIKVRKMNDFVNNHNIDDVDTLDKKNIPWLSKTEATTHRGKTTFKTSIEKRMVRRIEKL